MREYLYFSDRLAQQVLEDNPSPTRGRRKLSIAVRPGGIGPEMTWESSDGAPTSRHDVAVAVDNVIAGHAARTWDPNASSRFLRVECEAFLGELRNAKGLHRSAMIGAVYPYEGETVNLCLFGSRHNLVGTVPDLDPSRELGWFSSTTEGVRLLVSTVPQSADWDEEEQFAAAMGIDDSDLAWSAANIMRNQGMTGDGTRPHAGAPSLRGYNILEGEFEILARIFWWATDDQFGHIAVGAPLYVRSIPERPWSIYPPVEAGSGLHDLSLTNGRMELSVPHTTREYRPRQRWWHWLTSRRTWMS